MKLPSFIPWLTVAGYTSVLPLSIAASNSTEFEKLSKQATRNAETSEGYHYQNKTFLDAIDPALRAALDACTKSPDTVDGHPGEILFVVASDGRVMKMMFSPDVPLAKCVAAKLRSVSKLPRPPHDSYAVAIGVAKHDQPKEAKGPPDRPQRLQGTDQQAAYDKAIAPYVAKARASYPSAKKRFLDGLPQGYRFSVRVRLRDKDGSRFEDSFVRVEKISNDRITGLIENELRTVKQFKTGQRITIPESKIDNWVIVRPDGTEEGNYVGKFLDHYKPQ